MKCPRCGYVTHDYLDACGKCSTDWVVFKQEIHLDVIEPGDLDLSLVAEAGEDVGRFGSSREFSVDDSFFSTQTLLMNQEETDTNVDDDFDIELADTDTPGVVTEEDGTLLQEAAATEDETEREEVGLKEDSDFTMSSEDEEDEAVIDLAALEEEGAVGTPLASGESFTEDTPQPAVDVIDMSDLKDLDDADLDRDSSLEVDLASATEIEDVSEPEAVPAEQENTTLEDAAPELGFTPDLEEEQASETVPPNSEARMINPESEGVLDVEDLELELEEDDEKDC